MKKTLKVLNIEDSKNDFDLLLEHLRENGYQPDCKRVEDEAQMVQALDNNPFDIIICDHNLPQFDVSTAIAVAKNRAPAVPFIVVSGTVREDIAVKTLKAGAKDYVLKNNLSRLVPAIERALIDAESHIVHLRVEAELKKKEMELRQAQKLEAVGQLAGGVAHDFNNILAVILMQAEGALDTIDENPELKKLSGGVCTSLEQIRKAGNRAANLTRQLLAFSRKQVIQPKILDINEIVNEMAKMLSRVIPENIQLKLELDKTSKNIKVDPGHFEQVVMNLVVNSRDAMPEGGTIIVKTENSFITDEVAHKTNSKSGKYTLLQVIDTGFGMSEETQKHIFDPFFTTKEIGKGTGLGLSTVYGIVKQNSGLIFVESKVGVGTVFKIFFPQSEEGAEISSLALPHREDLRGSETILVAEDEDELRTIICDTLRESGYRILEARDGLEALQHVKSYKEPIDLVLTDVVMPKMGGRELYDWVKRLNPESKFLFLSGYTEDVLLQQGINSGQSHFLEKPFPMKTLLNKVRTILETETLSDANIKSAK